VKRKDLLTSFRSTGALGLAVLLALSACAQGDPASIASGTDTYEFPQALLDAGEAATRADSVTATTVPGLSAEREPVAPPPPRAAIEALEANGRPLPLPSSALLPATGPLAPSVITADGDRRLLKDVSVSVAYDPAAGFTVDPAGWWVVNYPLERIVGTEGRTSEEISIALLGRPPTDVTNYYFYTAPASGEKIQQLPAADGPAPIAVTGGPDLVVNNQHPEASDDNKGTWAHPLRTISAAAARAVPGDTIHVYPGVYREYVEIAADGTSDAPIRIEGIRGASGAMPVITGNEPFPQDAWAEVEGYPDVYRADAFTGLPGTVSVDGDALDEVSAPWDLEPGQFVVTSGGDAYVDPRFDGDVSPRAGTLVSFGQSQYQWEIKATDGGGFVDLGSEFGEDFEGGVYWGSAWVWVERPRAIADYQWYGTEDFDLQVSGPFRAGRVNGSELSEQPFSYRVWLDGDLLGGGAAGGEGIEAVDAAHVEPGRGDFGESWHGVVMREGWHHLVFQWDTTSAAHGTEATPMFRFGLPEAIGSAVTTATRPSSLRRAGSGPTQPYVSEYIVLGPVPSEYEPTVYLRMAKNTDPNQLDIDMAARSGPVVSILGDFVELRGFEIRHGAQTEGQSLVAVGRRGDETSADHFVQGVVVDGNTIVGSEYTGIDVAVSGDQAVAPIEIINNWVLNPGAVGIAAGGSSDRLTAATLNDWAPGRSRVKVAHNTIVGAGAAGYDLKSSASGILFEKMAGSTIAYNTISGGGPGITLRGENYGIRVDGNRISDPWGWGIGVDANPGPNLIANNLVTGLRNGPEWIKAHLLTWDSDQTWIINNTTDGEWGIETGWYGDIGSWGAGGPENFNRIDLDTWEMSIFRRTYINNLLLGSYLGGIEDYQGNWGETDTFDTNLREVPSPDPFDYLEDGAEKADVRRDFVDRNDGDYRLRMSSELNDVGAVNMTSRLASHDFFGLLRHFDETTSVGAFRPSRDVAPGASVIEVELADGNVVRIDG
jgi:hypothetical protein